MPTNSKAGDRERRPDVKQRSGSRGSQAKNKHIIEEFIYVGVPHRFAYDQWTQYQDWSTIFKKESAQAEDDGRQVTVTAKIGPSRRQWKAEVLSQIPGRRIEWEAKGGVQAKGVVSFHRLADRLTHLQVVIQYRPSGLMESVGNFFRMPRRRVRKDLKLFKNFIELRGRATGTGPGRIRGDGLSRAVDEQLDQAHRDGGHEQGSGEGAHERPRQAAGR